MSGAFTHSTTTTGSGMATAAGEIPIVVREETIEVPVVITRERVVEVEPKYVEKLVEREEIQIVEKIKPVTRIIEEERIRHVPKVVIKEEIVEIPQLERVEVPVEKTIVIPNIKDKIVQKPVMVPKYIDVPVEREVPVIVPTEVCRNGLALHEVTVDREISLPECEIVYEDVEFTLRIPRFTEVLPRGIPVRNTTTQL